MKKLPILASLSSLANTSRKLRMAIALCAFLTIAVPAVLSIFNYSPVQLVLAMVLLDICLYPTLRYFGNREGLPVLPVLCIAFAVQYAIPVFTQEPTMQLAYGTRYLDDSDIIAALLLSILGVVVLQIAYYALNYRKAITLLPHIGLPLDRRKAEIYCMSVLVLSVFLGRLQSLLSGETFLQFSAIIALLQNQLLVAIGIAAWLVFTHQGTRLNKFLLYAIVAASAVKGFATTMMESMMVPLAVLFMSKWFYTKRLPVSMFVLIGFLFLFLSPVKKNIRSSIVEERALSTEVSTTDRATDWIRQSLSYWSDAFSGRYDLAETTSDASSRTDLIHTFAHVYSLTPSVVPFQNGGTYSYLAIAWIPRAIWPEKPQANYANDFYAVAYEVSTEEGITHSSFGSTLMGEGYMNFGVSGVVLVMAFLGLVISLLEDVFAGKEAGAGGQAIFLSIFVYFLNGIGSSAELMFGGLVQNLIANCLLLWWVRARTHPVKRVRPELLPIASYKSSGNV